MITGTKNKRKKKKPESRAVMLQRRYRKVGKGGRAITKAQFIPMVGDGEN